LSIAFHPLGSLALGHQQRQARHQRPPADAGIAHQDHVPVIAQGQQAQQVMHQVGSHVDRRDLTPLGLRHLVLTRHPLALGLGGEPADHRFPRDAVTAQDGCRAHAALRQPAQRVLRAHLDLAAGLRDAAAFVQHDQHLCGERDRLPLIIRENEIGIQAGAAPGHRLSRSRQLIHSEAALDRQRDQQAMRGAVGIARESGKQQRRRQQRPAHGAHADRGRIQRRSKPR
jgi:hypothetical protein